MNTNFKYIKYTINHKKEYLKLEKKLLGKNTLSGYLHDLDKVFLYLILPKKIVQKIHRRFSNHHVLHGKNYLAMVIDWECARFSKPDKPLNARQTLYKYYPYLAANILPILNKYNL